MICHEIVNFLSDDELSYIEKNKYDSKKYKSSNNKTLTLYKARLPNTLIKKIKPYGDIYISQIYELEQPYRIHNDTRNEIQTKFSCIISLDINPQGGLIIFDQSADKFSYSLDNHYGSNYNKHLGDINDREKIIKNFDRDKKLPDIESLSHIKENDKIGFTIFKIIQYEFNKLIVFPSNYFHCSENIKNFTNKKSLLLITK